jgi:hypothetical protein
MTPTIDKAPGPYIPQMIWVKALHDNVFTRDRSLSRGESYETTAELAADLFKYGHAEPTTAPTVAQKIAKAVGL